MWSRESGSTSLEREGGTWVNSTAGEGDLSFFVEEEEVDGFDFCVEARLEGFAIVLLLFCLIIRGE